MANRLPTRQLVTISAMVSVSVLAGCFEALVDVPTQITVKLANETGLTVDPHLYASDTDVSSEDLFVATNIYANFDGSTVIDSGKIVTVVFACDQAETIGSRQALFADWTDWENAGRSEDSPVVHKDIDYQCGDVITFRFQRDNDGTYHTVYTVTGSP